MIQINRKLLGTFYLYTQEEALAKGIKFDNPLSTVKAGEWTLTDDNLVAQVIRIKKEVTEKNGYIRRYLQFAFGHIWITISKEGKMYKKNLSAKDYIKCRAFNKAAPITFGAAFAKAKRNKMFFKMYAKMIVDKKLTEENLQNFANIFLSNHKVPLAALKIIMRQEEVQEKMEEEVYKIMQKMMENDEDPKTFALKVILDAVKIAKDKKDAKSMVAAGKELLSVLEMYPKKSVRMEHNELQLLGVGAKDLESTETRLIEGKENYTSEEDNDFEDRNDYNEQ